MRLGQFDEDDQLLKRISRAINRIVCALRRLLWSLWFSPEPPVEGSLLDAGLFGLWDSEGNDS